MSEKNFSSTSSSNWKKYLTRSSVVAISLALVGSGAMAVKNREAKKALALKAKQDEELAATKELENVPSVEDNSQDIQTPEDPAEASDDTSSDSEEQSAPEETSQTDPATLPKTTAPAATNITPKAATPASSSSSSKSSSSSSSKKKSSSSSSKKKSSSSSSKSSSSKTKSS